MNFIKTLAYIVAIILEKYEDYQRQKKAREAEREKAQIRDNVADNLRDRGWLRDDLQDSGVSPEGDKADSAKDSDRM